jgi:hypothetical protein
VEGPAVSLSVLTQTLKPLRAADSHYELPSAAKATIPLFPNVRPKGRTLQKKAFSNI